MIVFKLWRFAPVRKRFTIMQKSILPFVFSLLFVVHALAQAVVTDAKGTRVAVDGTEDAWVDDDLNAMVKLGTRSDGTTARAAGEQVVVKDNGRVGIGTVTPNAYLHINNAAATANTLTVNTLSNSRDKQNTNIDYNTSVSPLMVDKNGNVYKQSYPVRTDNSALGFDGSYTVSTTPVNFVTLNNGSIVRFQLYTGSLLLGQAGIGANLYADITYGYGGSGFRVAAYGSESGGSATNAVTLTGAGTNTLTFDFAFGRDFVITNTSGTDAGPLAMYHVNGAAETITVEIFQSFRSR